MKSYIALSVVVFAIFFLAACGDDSSTSNNPEKLSDADMEVDSYGQLPSCSEKREGKTAYVVDQEQGYICENGKWVEDDDAVEMNSPSQSSSSKKGMIESNGSSLVVKASCNEKTDKNCIKDNRDGQTYKTVKIGDQVWMAENLNYETANSYCYDNDALNCTKYGRLYIWSAAMDSAGTWSNNGLGCGSGVGESCLPVYPVRGVCPEGWHLPDTTEWNALFTAVDDGSRTAGYMLKSTSDWENNGHGLDSYSFTALPAGEYSDAGCHDKDCDGGCSGGMGCDAMFWSSTEDSTGRAYDMDLGCATDLMKVRSYKKCRGGSIRCVKDDSPLNLMEYSSSSVKPLSSVEQKTVDPSTVVVGTMTDSRDSKIYKTVTIGSQTWMAENLNFETARSYCYDDADSNCVKYGRLYLWSTAMDSAGKWSTNGKGCGWSSMCSPANPVRGVCPEGWHLPTWTEFNTLITAVGGSSTAGEMLKSTSGWEKATVDDGNGAYMEKDGNGTDAYSFAALPAGERTHLGEGIDANFWSSTKLGVYEAYFMNLYSGRTEAYLVNADKPHGFSIRCVKD